MVSALIFTAFAQETTEAASAQWRAVADHVRPKVPKLVTIINGEIERRSEVVGIFQTTTPSSASLARCFWNRMTSGPSSAPNT